MKYVIYKDKIYMPTFRLQGANITADMEAPLQNIVIDVSHEDDPENIIIPTTNKVLNLSQAIQKSAFNVKYSIEINDANIVPTSKALNALYYGDGGTPTAPTNPTGIPVIDIQNQDEIVLTSKPTRANDRQANLQDGILFLVTVGDGRYEVAGLTATGWVSDSTGNTLPAKMSNLEVEMNNLQGNLNTTNTTISNLTAATLKTEAPRIRSTSDILSRTEVQNKIDDINTKATTNTANITNLNTEINNIKGGTSGYSNLIQLTSRITTAEDFISNVGNITQYITGEEEYSSDQGLKYNNGIIDINGNLRNANNYLYSLVYDNTANTPVNIQKTGTTCSTFDPKDPNQLLNVTPDTIMCLENNIDYINKPSAMIPLRGWLGLSTDTANNLPYAKMLWYVNNQTGRTASGWDGTTEATLTPYVVEQLEKPTNINWTPGLNIPPNFELEDENRIWLKIRFKLEDSTGATTGDFINRTQIVNTGDKEFTDFFTGGDNSLLVKIEQDITNPNAPKWHVAVKKAVAGNGGINLPSVTVNQMLLQQFTPALNVVTQDKFDDATKDIPSMLININKLTTDKVDLNALSKSNAIVDGQGVGIGVINLDGTDDTRKVYNKMTIDLFNSQIRLTDGVQGQGSLLLDELETKLGI